MATASTETHVDVSKLEKLGEFWYPASLHPKQYNRLVDMAVMLGLMVYYGGQGEWLPQLLACVTLVSSILTSYGKARAELMISHLPGGMFERGERIGILAAGGLFGVMVPALWVLALGTTWTASHRILSAYRELEALDAETLAAGEQA